MHFEPYCELSHLFANVFRLFYMYTLYVYIYIGHFLKTFLGTLRCSVQISCFILFIVFRFKRIEIW